MTKKKFSKRLGKMGKKFLVGASSSIVAGMLLVGTTGHVFADTNDQTPAPYEQTAGGSGMHMMHRWNSHTKAGNLAVQLGLDPQEVKAEIKSGKSVKQILQDHGIVPGQIQAALKTAKHRNKK